MKRSAALFLTLSLSAGAVCAMPVPAAENTHTYQLVLSDCTWSQAYQGALMAGGHLARFETREEYLQVLDQISREGRSDIMFRIGGRRDSSGTEYHWVDDTNALLPDVLNAPSSWMYSEWMKGEPSFRDGAIEETCLDMYYYQAEGRWVFNDVPDDIAAIAPFYSGRLGYIIEFGDPEAGAVTSSAAAVPVLAGAPDTFYFSSGVGGWGTEMTLYKDGSFTGSYHDSDMGSDTEHYPGGVLYLSNFSGSFTDFRKVDDYTWSMRLQDLDYAYAPETDWEEGGVHYIASEAYGLSGGDEFYLYLPGHPTSSLPEGFLSWARMYMGGYGDDLPAALNIYGIYNIAQEQGWGGSK